MLDNFLFLCSRPNVVLEGITLIYLLRFNIVRARTFDTYRGVPVKLFLPHLKTANRRRWIRWIWKRWSSKWKQLCKEARWMSRILSERHSETPSTVSVMRWTLALTLNIKLTRMSWRISMHRWMPYTRDAILEHPYEYATWFLIQGRDDWVILSWESLLASALASRTLPALPVLKATLHSKPISPKRKQNHTHWSPSPSQLELTLLRLAKELWTRAVSLENTLQGGASQLVKARFRRTIRRLPLVHVRGHASSVAE